MTSPATLASPRRRLRILRRPSESIRPATPRPQRRDCQGRLVVALLAHIGGDSSLVEASLRAWCSATFIGAQHRLTLLVPADPDPDRARRIAEALPEAELILPGHIVADLLVDALREGEDGATLLDLAVLTIEDW